MTSRAAHFRGLTRVTPADWAEDRLLADLDAVVTWLFDYVSRPAAGIGRSGPVCPFVPLSLRADAIRFHFHYRAGVALPAVLAEEIAAFASHAAQKPARSVIVAMPDIGPDGWRRIDEAYPRLKDAAVRRGFMIGQFHPACDVPAVRNPAWPVSRSPLALLVIRDMAPHDILFLADRRAWFAEFRHRFGADFETGKVRDALTLDRYRAAADRFVRVEADRAGG